MAAFSAFTRHNPSRTEQFRRQHRVGDTLKGELRAYISPDRAWVHIQGQTLVAAIRPGLTPGTKLLFTVQSLHPDIVLAECGPDRSSMRAAIQHVITARASFESMMFARDAIWATHFWDHIQADARLLGGYLAVLAKLRALDAHLAHGQRVAYCPWTLPKLAKTVLIFTPALPGTAIGEILGHGEFATTEVLIQATFTAAHHMLRCFLPKQTVPDQRLARMKWDDPALCPVLSPWERLLGDAPKSHYQTTI